MRTLNLLPARPRSQAVRACCAIILLAWAAAMTFDVASAGGPAVASLPVFQDLEEATARISRLEDRPYEKLWDDRGYYQGETLIFHDLETGNEVWSMSMELCTDLANIERRCAWSCNGQYISYIGNKVFWNHLEGKLWQRTWAGYNYVANADGSCRRKLWGKYDGRLRLHQDTLNTWDQKRGNVLYFAGDGDRTLWRVTLGQGEQGNVSEPIYRFPAGAAKARHIIQDIGDDNLLFVEESGGRSIRSHGSIRGTLKPPPRRRPRHRWPIWGGRGVRTPASCT
jgi:hypothetical protein